MITHRDGVKSGVLGLVTAVALATTSSNASAGLIDLSTRLSKDGTNVSNVVADGVTPYQLSIYVNNKDLGGLPTEGMDIATVFPAGVNLKGVNFPSADTDFFRGFEMYSSMNYLGRYGSVDSSGNKTIRDTRLTDIFKYGSGYGPADREGVFGVYDLVFDSSLNIGTTGSFTVNPTYTAFAGLGDEQFYSFTPANYTVISNSVPEPASLSLLAAGAGLLSSRRRKSK